MTCVTLILSGRVILGLADAVMQRLIPVLLLVSVFTAVIGLIVWFDKGEKSVFRQRIEWKPIVCMAGIVITLSVAGVIVGIYPALHSHHYSAAGLPILPAQISISIYASVCSAILANFVKRNILIRKILPILFAITIFLVAALMWTRVPIQETYFTQPSNLAGGSFVPNSDSLTYDSNAQLMLLGEGLAGGDALPRPLYSFILGILHLLVGTGIKEVINAQTIILALIPVGLYFLGRKIKFPGCRDISSISIHIS